MTTNPYTLRGFVRAGPAFLCFVALGAAAPAQPLPDSAAGQPDAAPSSGSLLWERAAEHARASRWFFPRAITVSTRVEDNKGKLVKTTLLETTLLPGPLAEPSWTLSRYLEDDQDRTERERKAIEVELAKGIDALFDDANPLLSRPAAGVQRLEDAEIDGAACSGFRAATEADGLKLALTIWIDRARGYARRIDARAQNVPLNKDGMTIETFESTTDYVLDAQGRWLAVRETAQTRFRATMLLFRFRGGSFTTTIYASPWEYRGKRRGAAPSRGAFEVKPGRRQARR